MIFSVFIFLINKNRANLQKKTHNLHYPFEIPEGWVWTKGNDCFKPMKSKKPTGEIFRYIDINSIDNKKHIIAETRLLNVSEAPSRASRSIDVGDTLFSMVNAVNDILENKDTIKSLTGYWWVTNVILGSMVAG